VRTTTSGPGLVGRTGPGAPAGHRLPPITPAVLARQVADVLADVPRFLAAPLLRHWHRTWGATEEEIAATMPGDELLPRAQYRCTRAITISATPDEVWPWLVQVGYGRGGFYADDLLPRAQYRCTRAITISATPDEVWPWLVQVGYGRGGFYADDLLDNFARPSARVIVPELQDIHVGQWLAMVPRPSERTAFRVDGFVAPQWLLWRTPNRTFAWRLRQLPGGRTRLVTRLQTVYEWSRPWVWVTVLLMEVGDYPMMRRMLRGIRDRSEAEHRRRAAGPREALAGGPDGT
jgi:hypothetical protein